MLNLHENLYRRDRDVRIIYKSIKNFNLLLKIIDTESGIINTNSKINFFFNLFFTDLFGLGKCFEYNIFNCKQYIKHNLRTYIEIFLLKKLFQRMLKNKLLKSYSVKNILKIYMI